MNRRKFFAIAPAAVLAPVAAHSAGTEPAGHTIDFDNLRQFEPGESYTFVMKNRNNPTLRVQRVLSEHTGVDGFIRRRTEGGFICLDGKVVGFIAFAAGSFSEVDIHAAIHKGHISPETARALRA